MKYAKYEKLDTKLEIIIQENNNCMYKENEIIIFIVINVLNLQSDLKYIIDEESIDKCKLLYNDRIESNVVSNKNNKQLNNRIIKTIPYRNKGIIFIILN